MKKIAITGGIGSGKTYITKIFKTLGIPIYYSDAKAKELLNIHPEIKKSLQQAFGKDIYTPQGINKKALADIIFHNKQALHTANQIIHPHVLENYLHWTQQQKQQQAAYTINESAIIFETQLHDYFHKIITVTAPKNLRIQRIKKREKAITKEKIQAILNNQIPEEEKIQKSHYIINNDEKQLLLPQILEIHHQISNEI